MYLFENYIQVQALPEQDSTELVGELELAGFKPTEIKKAFAWFAGLTNIRASGTNISQQDPTNQRVYTLEEKQKLGRRCLGLLIFLEQACVISPELRETIIDRAMAIEYARIEIEQLKWIILMVLYHVLDKHQDLDPDLSWIENLLFAETKAEILH